MERHVRPLYQQCQDAMGGAAAMALRGMLMKDSKIMEVIHDNCDDMYKIFSMSCTEMGKLSWTDVCFFIGEYQALGTNSVELMVLASLSRNQNNPTYWSWASTLEFFARAAQNKYKGSKSIPLDKCLAKLCSDLIPGNGGKKGTGKKKGKKGKGGGKKGKKK